MEIKLGVEAVDRVSGFKGIITSRIEYLNGCVQFAITPKVDKDNKREDGVWFDVGQIEVVGPGLTVKPKKTGGPTPRNTPTKYRG